MIGTWDIADVTYQGLLSAGTIDKDYELTVTLDEEDGTYTFTERKVESESEVRLSGGKLEFGGSKHGRSRASRSASSGAAAPRCGPARTARPARPWSYEFETCSHQGAAARRSCTTWAGGRRGRASSRGCSRTRSGSAATSSGTRAATPAGNRSNGSAATVRLAPRPVQPQVPTTRPGARRSAGTCRCRRGRSVDVLAGEHRAAVGVAEDELVEAGQQERAAGLRPAVGEQVGRLRVEEVLAPSTSSGPARRGPRRARPAPRSSVRHAQRARSLTVAGPWPRKNRSASSASASSRSSRRGAGIHSSRSTNSCSPSSRRPQAERAGLRQVPEQVVAALAGDVDAAVGHDGEQLACGPRGGRRSAPRRRPRGRARRCASVSPSCAHRADRPASSRALSSVEHPGQVLGDAQVQRAAHRPRADDRPRVEGGLDGRPGGPCVRRATDVSAPGRSWAWTAVSRRTASTAVRRPRRRPAAGPPGAAGRSPTRAVTGPPWQAGPTIVERESRPSRVSPAKRGVPRRAHNPRRTDATSPSGPCEPHRRRPS